MLRGLYDRVMAYAEHRHAMAALAVVSFIESSIFPIPPDILLVPMVLAARPKAWRIALVCTIASVLGGMAGYAIGAIFFDTIGRDVVELYGYGPAFAEFRAIYREWGAWIVAAAGFTPFPYKVITIASGVVEMNLVTFTIASVVSRGARFFLEAALLWYIGPPVRRFVENNLAMVSTAFFVLLLGGFLVVRFLV